MLSNIWIKLQEARKILAFLKKDHVLKRESKGMGFPYIVDLQGKVVYEAKSYEDVLIIMYAMDCRLNGDQPDALGIINYDLLMP